MHKTLEKRLQTVWESYSFGDSNSFRVLHELQSEVDKVEAYSENRADAPMQEALEFYLAALQECLEAVHDGMKNKGLMLGRIPPQAANLVRRADAQLALIPRQLSDFLTDSAA